MRSGNRRHAIVIEQPTESVGAGGENNETWALIANTRASIEPLSGRELFAAQQVHAEISTRITFRWREGVNETCRIRTAAPQDVALYGILAVLPDKSLRREITCLCVRRTSEGWRDGSGV